MVTSTDLQEIISKLSSDKAKAREEGIKLLCTWLEGERSVAFCKFLGQNTAKLKPNEVPHSDTWPFLITLLMRCISSEISGNKRRPPKIIFAKALRVSVQRAEDVKFSGMLLPLLSAVKMLFSHVLDVLSNVQSFQSEYGIMLRHLLAVRGYRFHMRKRIYCNLLLLFMEKVESSLSDKNNSQYNHKEEVFRHILTLQSLLENPPGDFPETLRDDIVKGFVRIFSFVRDEGKISRKLIECINTYLLKDGPNLGCQSLEIHDAIRHFIYSCWLTTHDRGLKDALYFYARLQLNLTRGADDASSLVEQLQDVIFKELDQTNLPVSSVSRSDGIKDDKIVTLSSSQCGLVELAALVFYRCFSLCTDMDMGDNVTIVFSVLWNATFRYLIRNYYTRMNKDLFVYWFDGICTSFERILNDANMGHTYDGLLWTLRSLQRLSCVLLLPVSRVEIPSRTSYNLNEACLALKRSDVWENCNRNLFDCGWQLVWNCLMHGLPIFSNVTTVVDAALVLLGSIISCDSINTYLVPQDVWDLQLFKQIPSVSVLYFIACYFSRKGSQGDYRDIFYLRKNLLTSTLSCLNWKDCSKMDDRMVLLLPAAVYALCAGCSPFISCFKWPLLSDSFLNVPEAGVDWVKVDENEHERQLQLFECCVEVLAKIDLGSSSSKDSSQCHQSVRLPRQLRDQLLNEMESYILGVFSNWNTENRSQLESMERVLRVLTSLYEDYSDCLRNPQSQMILSEQSVSGTQLQISCPPSIGSSRIVDMELDVNEDAQNVDILTVNGKIASGISCSAVKWKLDMISLISSFFSISHVTWDILFELMGKECSQEVCEQILYSLCQHPHLSSSAKIRDLVNSMDNMLEIHKLDCFNILTAIDYILRTLLSLETAQKDKLAGSSLKERESEESVWNSDLSFWNVKLNLLVGEAWSTLAEFSHFRSTCSHNTPFFISHHSTTNEKDRGWVLLRGLNFFLSLFECLRHLGALVNKIAEFGLLDWSGRVKLIDCICYFVLVTPQVGQTLIERLLSMLQDPDYRVRLFLARRIGVLFQTWDGHGELFQDICSNFGVVLVVCSNEKLVTAKEALASGPQPRPKMETIIITLMHLALQSESVELEAVFMMCTVSALYPCQRELVNVALDNLSQQLQYTTRWKYLEELLGPILFCWVACGVSLIALVEIRRLFVSDAEPCNFVQYCCHWLLPALVLHADTSNLNWMAKIAREPLADLVKNHFVPIFSISMAWHCSERSDSELGALVLQSSILHLAEISEIERDKLIKKHLVNVSIVSHIISLASCTSDPAVPYFSRDTIVHAVRTVVDGFLEMQDCPRSAGVVDKINVFRPDRFIVELHYKIAAAVHHRHKCHRLAGVEVLINVLGHRAAVSSASNYLFNLVGQFIGVYALQDQCCRIVSALLKAFRDNPSKEIVNVLGEQLQFLVSKLVACCIPSEANEPSVSRSSQVLSLLLQLTVDSDPSLHDYIRVFFPDFLALDSLIIEAQIELNAWELYECYELEPFPEIDIFDGIRSFHEELCQAYSARDHLLKFVQRACNLPSRLLPWRCLRALHKKLLMRETFQRGVNMEEVVDWHSDHDIVHAVWTLVHMCCSDDASSIRAWVSDFISRVGIGDPHCVVFHLPRDSIYMHACRPINHGSGSASEFNFHLDAGISEELLIAVLKILKKYLMDDSVQIVDMTSQTLRGILSTEKGQRAVMSFDSYERSLLEVHSKGMNVELVEKFLLDLERKFKANGISPEKSTVWETDGKTFETWICPLAYSLIGCCNDVVLRLCQDIVLLKSEVAELLLPSVVVNLAGSKNVDVDLQKLISSQVIFLSCLHQTDSNLFGADFSEPGSGKGKPAFGTDISAAEAYVKHSGSSAKPRSTSAKARDVVATSNATMTTSWDKVYWLSVDYLRVAKSAVLPRHIEILVSAVTQINEPDSLYGIIQSHKLSSQIVTLEHEGNWSKALEYYELQVRSDVMLQMDGNSGALSPHGLPSVHLSPSTSENEMMQRKPYKGLMRSLQQVGCMHVLDMYCKGLTSWKGQFQHDPEFTELQELVLSVACASEESTEYIYSAIVKLQILCHLGVAWDIRWKSSGESINIYPEKQKIVSEPVIPTVDQVAGFDFQFVCVLEWKENIFWLTDRRRVLLQILSCKDFTMQHLLESASTLRKGFRLSQAAAALHELKFLYTGPGDQCSTVYWLGRLEEAKLLRAQGQHEMAINLAKYISENYESNEEAPDVYRLVGKWLAESRSSNSRIILENYLKPAVSFSEDQRTTDKKSIERQCQTHFHLAHYADALFKSYEERLASNEWQAAMRLRKHKTIELEALIKRLKSSTKGEKTDYSIKIQELQKQLAMDREEAQKLLDDRDNFLGLALEGYKRCLVIGDKYDVRVVFRLVSLWFSLSSRQNVIKNMVDTIDEVQSYKFIPLVYQIASRMGSTKDALGLHNFQFALVSLVKKMAIDHPYHTIFQDKQCSRNSFVVDMDKKLAAENLLEELSSYHGAIIRQMKQMVDVYIKLAELETRREVPVVTATVPIDCTCQYNEGSFPYFKGLAESVMVMNGINAPKVVECFGSDGHKYRQLAKSGNDDLRQDAYSTKVLEFVPSTDPVYVNQLCVNHRGYMLISFKVMEQFFGLVNTFLRNHRDTWKRRLGVRTYKYKCVVTGMQGTYVVKDKRIAFQEVCENFRPVLHYFFLERFLQPAYWFEKRLAYTRSVAASSMVGYIVGLGDRHAMNILIDQATAEVVHIDLGVAFEQGLMLKTPERVPFRLTRDIIDGMGVTGVEGVFRRCCEKTLSVMRTNKEALLTIVEVFIHDPLYKWALSPLKALQRQKEMDDDLETGLEGPEDEYEGNKDAERALIRVKQKLDGYEGGEMRSVHGQVQQLIQDAIDPERFCLMFPGWGAWL
ncbi:serine/threonine-protein kinase ATM [Citrus sinensis]|uniref:Serine/threonine-protein kinase ATM n=1 Tax=Citrus sinensis TaxID=2711 RepID=A0ACB8LS11_CITSI|nr:serine/threonine-protein kinase ATM [Citrus sinensis]